VVPLASARQECRRHRYNSVATGTGKTVALVFINQGQITAPLVIARTYAASALAHWRGQLRSGAVFAEDRVEIFSPAAAAALQQWYAPVSATGLANAALLRAVERGAKTVYDWALPAAADDGKAIELELETTWPLLLPEVLPGVMPSRSLTSLGMVTWPLLVTVVAMARSGNTHMNIRYYLRSVCPDFQGKPR
jgi:hypothetical protein